MPGRLRALLTLLLLTLGFAAPLYALQGLEGPTPTEAAALAEAADHASYTLPPDKLKKAQALSRIGQTLDISGVLWTPLQLILLLATGTAAWMRSRAEALTRRRWLQVSSFLLLLLLAHTLLDLPIRVYAHHVGLAYGLSVQRWPAWFADLGKGFALTWLIGSAAAIPLLLILRRSPRLWWLWVWPVAISFVLAGVLLTPYVFDPLFNHFEPLSQSDPALVTQLERVVERSSIPIPSDRMFLMKASEKYTGMNAYVTGFGPSKRIVVWDTTVAHSTPGEIAFVFAHELGHYALGHVVLGILLSSLGLLPLFYLSHVLTAPLARCFCSTWNIRLPWQDDLAAIVALLLVLSVLGALSDPLGNAISRRMEHNADVYGQEAVHGIVADPQAVGVRSFQDLGERSLEDPTPHPLFDSWFGTHPPIWLRAAFTRLYNPWAEGQRPKYFAR